jgi:hypothetical protein
MLLVGVRCGGGIYQDQKAMKKPSQEKKKTRPYLLRGFSTGIERAFPLRGLSSGADQRRLSVKAIGRGCVRRAFTGYLVIFQRQTRFLWVVLLGSSTEAYRCEVEVCDETS